MAINIVDHTSQISTDSNGFTTSSAINTSGATLVVVVISSYGSSTAPVLTDSKGNSWTQLVEQSNASNRCNVYYAYDTGKVGSSHTFTLTQNGSYCSVCVAAYSGTRTSSDPLTDQQGTFLGTGDPTIQPPAINAGTGGDLAVAFLSSTSSNVFTIDNGGSGATFSIVEHQEATANGQASALAWKTFSGSTQPTWSNNSGSTGATNAAFAQAAGAASDSQEWLTNTVVQQSRKNVMTAY